MIKPTVGRVVWFYTGAAKEPLAAIIAKVHNDRLVNLMVIAEEGIPCGFTFVDLLQDSDDPHHRERWCAWMPYQLGQAARGNVLLAEKAASA